MKIVNGEKVALYVINKFDIFDKRSGKKITTISHQIFSVNTINFSTTYNFFAISFDQNSILSYLSISIDLA